jgi:hypothetical protein
MFETPLGVSPELVESVQREIEEHSIWCSKQCQNFVPEEYAKNRLGNRIPRYVVQQVYHLSHDWR